LLAHRGMKRGETRFTAVSPKVLNPGRTVTSRLGPNSKSQNHFKTFHSPWLGTTLSPNASRRPTVRCRPTPAPSIACGCRGSLACFASCHSRQSAPLDQYGFPRGDHSRPGSSQPARRLAPRRQHAPLFENKTEPPGIEVRLYRCDFNNDSGTTFSAAPPCRIPHGVR
jgi:hypothetical protein